MTNNAYSASETREHSGDPLRGIRQLSPQLCAIALVLFLAGVVSGWGQYQHRSAVREAHAAGTAAWPAEIVLAVAACAWYGIALWRHRRQFGPRSGRPLLLAPLSRDAAGRVLATLKLVSWRTVASKPPLLLICYCFWRVGEQITIGLDPNHTVNAWGGPTYLGALVCVYLDAALVIYACAWLTRYLLVIPGEDRARPPRGSRPSW